MSRRLLILLALVLVLGSCNRSSVDTSGIPDLEVINADQLDGILSSLDRPAVVNVWASWCIPCRSEAPLLRRAHQANGEDVEFIGIDVQDSQSGAKQFIAEFGIDFTSYFDRDRAIPMRYGGIGTPITFFFAPGGRLVSTHNGVIDDQALALGIDELLAHEG
ncbi:MAG: TlpA disulfide reductase family protein [Acidimicrobiia bacterium]